MITFKLCKMSRRLFRSFVIINLFILLCFCEKVSNNNKQPESISKHGYVARLLNSGPCDSSIKPAKPYDKNPAYMLKIETYRTSNTSTLMRGHFIVTKTTNAKDLVRLRGYQMKEGKWLIKYNFNNIPCDGLLRTYITKFLGFHKSCNFPKGNYTFEILDFNQLDHLIWPKARELGRLRWVVEMYMKQGTQFCHVWDTINEPIDK